MERSINNQISTTMSKTKKQPVKQERAAQEKQDASSVKKTATEVQSTTSKDEDAKEIKHREPQMITVNGDKVTHAHTFRSNVNPENIFFTAKINGEDLKPHKMDAEDVKAYHDRTIGVEELMKKYYPTKVMQKVSKEEFQAANKLSDGRTIEKFAVFKEDNEKSKDYGKYRMYALVGNQKLFKTLSHEDLNAYFDRVTTPKALVEKNFGEYLNLASAYEKYKLPEGVKLGDDAVSIRKGADGDWVISADLGEKGHTPERKITKSDLYSVFNAHTATKAQLAAKYLSNDIKDAKAEVKQSQSRGMKV